MAIPKEFQFDNEDDFIQRFIIPLLHRLGFSIVANYHRTGGEFGKDLVFGEVDRFGHVRYYGLQAKYVDSIGLSAVETVIQDCRQAFANPFNHPQTHSDERIQTFYAINGGSISPDATSQFFNSVGYPLATCARLIDGKALLTLDRYSTANQSANIMPELGGLLNEVRYNRAWSTQISPLVDNVLSAREGKSPNLVDNAAAFSERLRVGATSRFVQCPVLFDNKPLLRYLDFYYQDLVLINALLDRCTGLGTVGATVACFQEVRRRLPNMVQSGDVCQQMITEAIGLLRPLVAI